MWKYCKNVMVFLYYWLPRCSTHAYSCNNANNFQTMLNCSLCLEIKLIFFFIKKFLVVLILTKPQKWFMTFFFLGHGLCPVEISTEHVQIWTRVQEWTHVHHLTCPVETSTRHKSHPFFFTLYIWMLSSLVEPHQFSRPKCRSLSRHSKNM